MKSPQIMKHRHSTLSALLGLSTLALLPTSGAPLTITPTTPPATGFDFEWESRDGKVYDLVTSTDLATPILEWPLYDPDGEGGKPPYGDIPARAGSTTTTLAAVPGGGARRFFAIVEKDAPPPPAPPELRSVVGGGTTLTLNFTGEMEETAATNPWNYDVANSDVLWPVISAVLSADGKTVTLTLGSPLSVNTTYNVIMRNLAGSDGTPLGGNTTVQFSTM
jgi:hypothetical protein